MEGFLDGFGVLTLVLLVVALAVLFAGIKSVPQGEPWTVERFGRDVQTLMPGLRFIIPFIDRIEIRDIRISEEFQNAMNLQMTAERRRRATVTEANGRREAAVLEAEGEAGADPAGPGPARGGLPRGRGTRTGCRGRGAGHHHRVGCDP